MADASAAARLRAVTRRLDPDVDLLHVAGEQGVVFTRRGVGLAGRGVALRTTVAAATDDLAAIEVDDTVDTPGTGPVAFGVLPFSANDSTELVVPAVVVGRGDDGTRWITTVSPVDAPAPPLAPPEPEATPQDPSRFEVAPGRDPQDWCRAVAAATTRIRAGELEKVVLAREVLVHADAPIPVVPLLTRLRAAYPDCFTYGFDGYLGSSPELLVGRHGDIVRSQPMAGTTARRGDPQADARAAAALLASPGYRHEHQVTIDMVHDTLVPFCSYLDYEPEPSVVALANVSHLATQVEGRLSSPAASVLELVQALHPTPAVCGRPREVARRVIADLEGFDRGRYAGAVGWVDRHGNGQWAVAIRSTQLRGSTAHVYAGNGLVADSDPVTELAETRAKLQAVLGAVIRP